MPRLFYLTLRALPPARVKPSPNLPTLHFTPLRADRVVPPDLTLAPPDFASRAGAQDAGAALLTERKGTKTMNDTPRIYVADLAAYNNGKLHGVWIDATDAPDDIQEQINAMLAQSPEEFSEEWALHDYEGFEGLGLSEYEGIERVHELACFIEEHGKIGAELLSHFGGNLDDARRAMDEDYCGCYESLADYVQELTEDTTQIPESLQYYIDYERMGRDMEMGGDVFTIETGYKDVHIFWNH